MMRYSTIFALIAFQCLGVPFQNLRFDTNIDTNAINAVNNRIAASNDTFAINSDGRELPSSVISEVNGITFEVKEDGEIRFIIQEEFFPGHPYGSSLDRITINGKSLRSTISEIVDQKLGLYTPVGVENKVNSMVYNPLWGKKLAIIGDSLTCTPRGKSYGDFIAQRNNMVLVHNGRGGEKLCNNVTNASGTVTNPSTISSYTNDIPADADFILCQIGTNDSTEMWNQKRGWEVDDTSMDLTTFKGCFNQLLIGLKKNYPNAKIGIILPNNWVNNLGKNSEEQTATESQGSKRQLSQWQKVQCQKLNIPVFDPVEDTRMVVWNLSTVQTNGTTITAQGIQDSELNWYEVTKKEIGTSQTHYNSNYGTWNLQSPYFWDSIHMSEKGNLLMSFFYENWMKTVLMAN